MHLYLSQLLNDITGVTQHISDAQVLTGQSITNWISGEEEEQTAPLRNLQEYTGISEEMLPPASMLAAEQIASLLEALQKMLEACNCHFVLQTDVPAHIQYETIRQNFNQEFKLKQWHMGFFQLCKPGTEHKTCAMGKYCHCVLFEEMFANFVEEDLSPEEERARALEIEVQHIKRKYGSNWMKYYPYHLDKNYDDEKGNPYNYGFDEEEDDEDEWWKQ
jgi:hypothetical protein